jgi:hypothetical protein
MKIMWNCITLLLLQWHMLDRLAKCTFFLFHYIFFLIDLTYRVMTLRLLKQIFWNLFLEQLQVRSLATFLKFYSADMYIVWKSAIQIFHYCFQIL